MLYVVRRISFYLLSVLAFLRRMNIIHADIKPDNILLEPGGDINTVTLIDFGNVIQHTQRELSLYYTDFELQTQPYRAPEVHLGHPFSHEVDMWSLGCVLLELLTGRQLFSGANRVESLKKMVCALGPLPVSMCKQGKFYHDVKSLVTMTQSNQKIEHGTLWLMSVFPRIKNWDFFSFLSGLLTYNPEKRMTPWEALHHSFMTPKLPVPRLLTEYAHDTGVIKKSDNNLRHNIASNLLHLQQSALHLLHSGIKPEILSQHLNSTFTKPFNRTSRKDEDYHHKHKNHYNKMISNCNASNGTTETHHNPPMSFAVSDMNDLEMFPPDGSGSLKEDNNNPTFANQTCSKIAVWKKSSKSYGLKEETLQELSKKFTSQSQITVDQGPSYRTSGSTHKETFDKPSGTTHKETFDKPSGTTHKKTSIDKPSGPTHKETFDKPSGPTHNETFDKPSGPTHKETFDKPSGPTHKETFIDKPCGPTHKETFDKPIGPTHKETFDKPSGLTHNETFDKPSGPTHKETFDKPIGPTHKETFDKPSGPTLNETFDKPSGPTHKKTSIDKPSGPTHNETFDKPSGPTLKETFDKPSGPTYKKTFIDKPSGPTHKKTFDKSSGPTHNKTFDKLSGLTHKETFIDKPSGPTHKETFDKPIGPTHKETFIDKSSGPTHNKTFDKLSGPTHKETFDKTSGPTHNKTFDKLSGPTHKEIFDKSSGPTHKEASIDKPSQQSLQSDTSCVHRTRMSQLCNDHSTVYVERTSTDPIVHKPNTKSAPSSSSVTNSTSKTQYNALSSQPDKRLDNIFSHISSVSQLIKTSKTYEINCTAKNSKHLNNVIKNQNKLLKQENNIKNYYCSSLFSMTNKRNCETKNTAEVIKYSDNLINTQVKLSPPIDNTDGSSCSESITGDIYKTNSITNTTHYTNNLNKDSIKLAVSFNSNPKLPLKRKITETNSDASMFTPVVKISKLELPYLKCDEFDELLMKCDNDSQVLSDSVERTQKCIRRSNSCSDKCNLFLTKSIVDDYEHPVRKKRNSLAENVKSAEKHIYTENKIGNSLSGFNNFVCSSSNKFSPVDKEKWVVEDSNLKQEILTPKQINKNINSKQISRNINSNQSHITSKQIHKNVKLNKAVSDKNTKQVVVSDINTKQIVVNDINTKQVAVSDINTKQVTGSDLNTKQVVVSDINTKQVTGSDINTKQVAGSDENAKQVAVSDINTKQVAGSDINTKQVAGSDINTKHFSEETKSKQAGIVIKNLQQTPTPNCFHNKSPDLDVTVSKICSDTDLEKTLLVGSDDYKKNCSKEQAHIRTEFHEVKISYFQSSYEDDDDVLLLSNDESSSEDNSNYSSSINLTQESPSKPTESMGVNIVLPTNGDLSGTVENFSYLSTADPGLTSNCENKESYSDEEVLLLD